MSAPAPAQPPPRTRLDYLEAHLEMILNLQFVATLVVLALVVVVAWAISELTGHGSGPLGAAANTVIGAVAGAATNKGKKEGT